MLSVTLFCPNIDLDRKIPCLRALGEIVQGVVV